MAFQALSEKSVGISMVFMHCKLHSKVALVPKAAYDKYHMPAVKYLKLADIVQGLQFPYPDVPSLDGDKSLFFKPR